MPDNFNKDNKNSIEDEIEKSLLLMVEEETNVAKAYVDNHNPNLKQQKDSSLIEGKTQVIPSIPKEMLKDDEDDIIFDYDYLEKDTKEKPVSDRVEKKIPKKPVKKGIDNKTKLIIAGIVAALLIIVIGIIVLATSLNNKTKDSYDYYYQKGMDYYNKDNYEEAADYLSKAVKKKEGKKNLELKYNLYLCYDKLKETDESISILKDILSYDEDYKDAISAIAKLYYDNEYGEELTKLIRNYQDTSNKEAISKYIVSDPEPSEKSGSYDDTVSLKLTCGSGDMIYYTTDGSEPTKKSSLYDGTPIEIGSGTTKIKVIAMNSAGVMSNVVELEYIVEFGAPGTPEVLPTSGTYEKGEKVKVTVPEKCKAYYTLDGTTPSKTSTEYTGEFEMPEGNTIVSVVIINDHEQSSTVTKRNYVVNVKTTYSYDAALSKLQDKLIANGVLKNKTTAADGSSVEFGYQTKTTVDSVEMIIIKYSVKGTSKYYGVGVSTGATYTVVEISGQYKATAY